MAQPLNDNALQDLERHRLLLETQTTQLRKALQTWQLWSAEYEGLKEEVESLSSPTNESLLAIGQNFNGQVVTLVEIDDILNLKGEQRNAAQIINLLDRRIDYVAQNVKTAEKQLHAAEEKLEKVGMVSEELEDSGKDDEGLPLTEIIEELDDEGNVISYKTNTPGSEKQQLLDVLRQVGVTEDEIQARGLEPVDETEVEEDDATKVLPMTSGRVPKESTDMVTEAVPPTRPSMQPRKKSVTFTEDTKPGPSEEPSQTDSRVAEIMSLSKAQNEPLPSTGPDAPIVPTSESEEEAALRREMLQYSMSEIGAVVAELDLESGSEWSQDDEGYDDEFSDGDEDEDAFGRSTRKAVDDDLHQRMRELEEKLGVRMMQNLGPKPSSDVSTERSEPDAGIAQIRITQEDVDRAAHLQAPGKPVEAEKVAKKGKKGVRFADDIDVSPAPEVKPAAKPTPEKPTVIPAPITDIVERQPAPIAAPTPPTAKKASRFKSSRQANPVQGFIPPQPPVHSSRSERTVPTGPENATLATQVVEREVLESGGITEPDELDPGLLHQEVSTEFHRLRNRMIQREGGFKKKEEEVDDEGTILEYADEYDDEGKPKKMSRFMAARLGRQ
ncbi:hypothetical protein V493_04070 [Pseudogymnoascus sp. VKM F-4281 (FW-2241)]|nr:hypothetical protein V493_04070 [Pseudogymnoascus sp. VKM F-4281 (FW-2241)]